MKKIVITGLGMVTPVGNGKVATWEALKAGKCGIGRITKFDPSRCTCQVAGELKDFDAYLSLIWIALLRLSAMELVV